MGPRHAGRGIAEGGRNLSVQIARLQWARGTRAAVSVLKPLLPGTLDLGFNGSAARGPRYRCTHKRYTITIQMLQWVRGTRAAVSWRLASHLALINRLQWVRGTRAAVSL